MAEAERKVHCVLAHVISLFVFLETVSYYVIRLVSNSKFFLQGLNLRKKPSESPISGDR